MECVGELMGMPVYMNRADFKKGFIVVSHVATGTAQAQFHVVAYGQGGLTEQRYSVAEVMQLALIAKLMDKTEEKKK